MEWVLRSPQIHSTFGNLGYLQADGYHINDNCNAALESILHNILTEDKYLRTYRRSISFGQNIKKDLIPLLIHAKEDKTIELLIKILVNLTIPIECLLSMNIISKTDFGRHTIFEINNLLASTKAAFTDNRTTRIIVDFLKKNIDVDQKAKLSLEQCTNISNSLLLLRNILHIPEDNGIQNQILWNIFSQGVDKVLIKLMTIPDAINWVVTMVQLIALLYKDQHVVTLHKLLNMWLEASLSESSEDNESNTSQPDRGSEDSSPMLTSDPTSDSSDTGGSGKSNDDTNANSIDNDWNGSSANNSSGDGIEPFMPLSSAAQKQSGLGGKSDYNKNTNKTMQFNNKDNPGPILTKREKKTVISETSDCGYGTQIENQESVSTSSNEDDMPTKKPVHQKPYNAKQRINNKGRTGTTAQDRKRKKIVKRGKSNILNVQGLLHKTPTDDDISNILKEFTVDFLLKGYNALVQTLYSQILTNLQLEIDTSHFFWLVTYFMKFATQIELDLKHVCSVLSFDIASYLTAEGVNLCEQFELAIKLDGNDLKPSLRRLHLVVTALRELVQAIEVYKKFTHVCKDDQDVLIQLQIKMCETEELRSLLVLLLRHYNPKYHSKQYLQDLIVTNHILLSFFDNVMKLPEYNGTTNMHDHIKQFATTEVMYQYGLLLEDYASNGEFVNDCIFTLMHHVGGEIGSLTTLFQPKILKTFTSIWKSEFDICDDWSDLIEYVMNTFIKKPHTLQHPSNLRKTENLDDDKVFVKPNAVALSIAVALSVAVAPSVALSDDDNKPNHADAASSPKDRWTENEVSSLSWYFMQCNSQPDAVNELIKMFKEDGIVKTRHSVIKELFKQNLIDNQTFENFMKSENEKAPKGAVNKETREDEIKKLCKQLTQDGKLKSLTWVQKVLLETCYAKIYIEKKTKVCYIENTLYKKEAKIENLAKESNKSSVVSPVSYHYLLCNQSVPLVPWNCEQVSICRDLKFLQLLHKLGFYMPVDSGKVFIRIPHFWTAEFLYEVAGKILPVCESQLKFSLNDITNSNVVTTLQTNSFILSKDLPKDVTVMDTTENFYQVHKQKHLATMINFTPMPGSTFHSEGSEPVKPNWLELIQKSQEYKITLNFEKRVTEHHQEADVVMQLSRSAPSAGPLNGSPLAAPPMPFAAHASPLPFTPPPFAPHAAPPPFVPHAAPQYFTPHASLSSFAPHTASPPFVPHTAPQLFVPHTAPQLFVPHSAPPLYVSHTAPPPFAPLAAPPPPPPPSTPHAAPPQFALLMPVLPAVIGVNPETSTFNVQLAEPEYCINSVCETASAASDLNRMYVSDEDEKSEVPILPIVSIDPMLDEMCADVDTTTADDEPLNLFSPNFNHIDKWN